VASPLRSLTGCDERPVLVNQATRLLILLNVLNRHALQPNYAQDTENQETLGDPAVKPGGRAADEGKATRLVCTSARSHTTHLTYESFERDKRSGCKPKQNRHE
jgi:hypothetical protein